MENASKKTEYVIYARDFGPLSDHLDSAVCHSMLAQGAEPSTVRDASTTRHMRHPQYFFEDGNLYIVVSTSSCLA